MKAAAICFACCLSLAAVGFGMRTHCKNQTSLIPQMLMTLESTIAGTWYPGTEVGIRSAAAKWEAAASAEEPQKDANIVILPHAGWTYSGETAWRAIRAVRGKNFRRAVILAPSHRAWIENRLVAPEAASVSTPLGKIEIDREWLDRLSLLAPVAKNDKVHSAEHSTQIEYPLLQLALGNGFRIVPLIVGALGRDQMGMCVRAISRLMDSETLLVVSSDFTHYGSDFSYTPYGTNGGTDVRASVAADDAKAIKFITSCDADSFASFISQTGATICGHLPIELALRSLPSGASITLPKYATSADGDGDFSRFVCYAALTGHADWTGETDCVLDKATRDFLLRVARESMEQAVRNGRTAPKGAFHADAPKAALARMGAFVTLNDKVTGALRGCIGEIMPMRPLVDAVAQRAVDAALNDPRFPRVTERELASLRVEVSALTPPRKVDSWRDIVLGRDGMTLEKNGAFAVFLPQVAPEQGWDLPTTLSYLSMKAGLSQNAWRDGADFEVFQAEVFHE